MPFTIQTLQKHTLTLATLTLFCTYLLIVVGAATRVYDAGMACPDWPACYGHLMPFPESKIPSGYVVNGQHYVWWQVMLEWGHRALAMLVGLALLSLIALAVPYARQISKTIILPLILAVLLLALQIKLGAVTVWWNNAPWTVMIHLGNAMLFFAAIVWLRRVIAIQVTPRLPNYPTTPLPVKILAIIFTLAVWLTMLIGAYTSSSHSGGVCGGLFTCLGQWWVSPQTDIQQHIHMQHRLWALITTAASIALLILAKRTAPHLRKSAVAAHLMIWGQITLGIATLYSFEHYPSFYYPLSIAHLAWGTLLFTASIGLLLTITYGAAGRFHQKAS